MFGSILNETAGNLSISTALICMATAILLGIALAVIHMLTSKYSKNFLITLSILPLIVQVVIMMVNGNLGTSVAVLGAFSLVRFRSVPGNSREIASIFSAMAIGLAIGMGYIAFAIVITVVLAIVLIILSKTHFGENKIESKKLKIVIPENLDYTEIFDDIFDEYLAKCETNKVKTTNMGSMYELTYNVIFKSDINEKEFIDKIRCRNGNLTVLIGKTEVNENEL